ncbi:MAG: chemotaxis protein CheA [Bacteroidales bacterium]|nr:chemotaxis protein CheA [Bacteroidales bacterium]
MLDRFQQKFVEEATDNVASIEEALFELESDPENKEIIERLFRSMHTIKGGGAMFGFNDLSNFTHNLETIYDHIRNDKIKVTKDIISLTFESLDYIRQLLEMGQLTDPDDIARQQDYIKRLQAHFAPGEGLYVNPNKAGAQQAAQPVQQEAAKEEEAGPKNYLVNFEPFENLLSNGTNPLFIIEDLMALGEAKTVSYLQDVHPFTEFEPLTIRIKWQVILQTDQDVNDIKDVFIFVEDDCKVEIAELPKGDIVNNTDKLPEMMANAHNTGVMLKKEDFDAFKVVKAEAAAKKQEAGPKQPQQEAAKIATQRVSSAKIDELVNAVGELVTMQAQLNLIASKSDNEAFASITEQMEKITRQLRETSFEMSLVPLQGELVRFQRLVRDLSNKLGKELEFVVEGGEIELDKNIIEHLIDPLLHIIRNSGDHGIEMPDERIKKGKNPKGTILLKAFYSGSNVVIQIIDDGKGMDPEKIFAKAVEKGIIDKNANLTKKEILNLIFASGFSTAEKISDVSGRGVGMDVVRTKIQEVRGEVTVDSEIDKGTTLTLDIPLTLSIIDGLMTKVNGEQFIFPLSNIERILNPQEVKFNENGVGNIFTYTGEQILYIDLNNLFYQKPVENMMDSKILLVKNGDKRVGMVIDQIVGEYQIVVKPLGRFLRKVDMISGASVMGDGSLSLIVDTTRLINYNKGLRNKKQQQVKKEE